MSSLKHSISQDKVKQLTSHYEKNKKQILKDEFQNGDTLPTSETFDRAAFDHLLAQEGCVGIRIYYGMDENMEVKLVVVGVNESDQDIRPATSNVKAGKNKDATDETIYAFSNALRCPPICPPPPPPPPPNEL